MDFFSFIAADFSNASVSCQKGELSEKEFGDLKILSSISEGGPTFRHFKPSEPKQP